VQRISGTLTLESTPGSGTRITVAAPVRKPPT